MKNKVDYKNNISTDNNNVLCPVIFEGRKFFGICKFDCICVDLFTEKTLQGTFLTVIPISSAEYRKKKPTKAKVEIKIKKNWTLFKIYSDFGQYHEIEIHNSLSKDIEFARNNAIEQGLL